MAATDLFQTSTPDPNKVGLDPGTQNLLNKQVETANKGPEYFSGLINQGVSDKRLAQPSGDQSEAGTGMSQGQLGALRQSYAGQAQQGINRIMDQNKLQGSLMKADYMSKVSQALLHQQMQYANQYQVLTQAYNQSEAARAGAINSLFQLANVGIGQYAANQSTTSDNPLNINARTGGFNPEAQSGFANEFFSSGGNRQIG